MLWAKSSVGTTNDISYSVCTDANGNVFITGGFQSPTILFETTTLTNIGAGDIFVVKYDTFGNLLWAKSAGGTAYDRGKSVFADLSGKVFITGEFYSPSIIFGTTTLISGGTSINYSDIFIAELDSTQMAVGSKEMIWNKNEILISPNPFTSQTTISFSDEQKNTTIKITDVLGNIVNSEKATGKSVIIDMSGFEKGIYFVQITDEKKNVINKKIVVQ